MGCANWKKVVKSRKCLVEINIPLYVIGARRRFDKNV